MSELAGKQSRVQMTGGLATGQPSGRAPGKTTRVEQAGFAGQAAEHAHEVGDASDLPASTEAQIKALLNLRIAADDDDAIQARKHSLVAAFRAIREQHREALHARLSARDHGSDELAALFHGRLAAATCNTLLKILSEPSATPDVEPQAHAAPRKQSAAAVGPSGASSATAVSAPSTSQGASAAASSASQGARKPGDPQAQGHDDAWSAIVGEASESVGKMARVKAERGVRLRTEPHVTAATQVIMPFDTLVHVERRTAHGWCYVVALGDAHGQPAVSGSGFCENNFLQYDAPEPGAHLHHVGAGEMPKDIAAEHYKSGGFNWGSDARLFVEAIWEANRGRSKGVYRNSVELSFTERMFRTESQEENLKVWRSIGVRDSHAIWIPSPAFVQQLKSSGAISSGSISHDAWDKAKDLAEGLVDWAKYGAGFVVGVLEGAFGAVRDLVMGAVDLLSMLYDLVKSLISNGLVGTAKSIGGKLRDLFEKAPDLLAKVGDWFMGKWNAKDSFDRGEFQGEVIGYVMAQALILFLTAGASAALQGTGKFATLIKVVRGLDAAGDIFAYASAASKVVKLPAQALGKLGKAMRRGDDVADAAGDAARAANRAGHAGEHAADAAGDASRHAGKHDVDAGKAPDADASAPGKKIDTAALIELHRKRVMALKEAGEFEKGTFHGSGSAMLDGLGRTDGEILPAAELIRRGDMPVTGEGSKFSGAAGPKKFVSVGHGESGLGTSLAYADAAKGLGHYNPKLLPYDQLQTDVKRLQYIFDNYDSIKVDVGGPMGQMIKRDKGQIEEELVKLNKELARRNSYPADSPHRKGGPGNTDDYPVLFEFDTADMGKLVEHRPDVKAGGILGGEASVHAAIDLKKRMRRAYAPAEHVAKVQARLAKMFGHTDFEVIAIEALDAVSDSGLIGGSRKATYKSLADMEKNVTNAERAYEAAGRQKRTLDAMFYFEQMAKP